MLKLDDDDDEEVEEHDIIEWEKKKNREKSVFTKEFCIMMIDQLF